MTIFIHNLWVQNTLQQHFMAFWKGTCIHVTWHKFNFFLVFPAFQTVFYILFMMLICWPFNVYNLSKYVAHFQPAFLQQCEGETWAGNSYISYVLEKQMLLLKIQKKSVAGKNRSSIYLWLMLSVASCSFVIRWKLTLPHFPYISPIHKDSSCLPMFQYLTLKGNDCIFSQV